MSTSKRTRGIQSLYKGESGQSDIASMFQRWCWTTAKPQPDLGGDFIVQAHAEPGGAGPSFLVQVKARTREIGTFNLDHNSAAHLRDQVLPAFLFYLNLKAARVKWAYLEPLFNIDAGFLKGGPLRVPLPPDHGFDLRGDCPPALLASIELGRQRGGIKALPSIAGHARETQRMYAEIDPRFIVTPTFDGIREVLQINAASEPVSLSMSIQTASGIEALRATYDWGREAELDNCHIEFRGSKLFEFLAAPSVPPGKLTFTPLPAWEGQGLLSVSEPVSADELALLLPVDVTITKGQLGAEMLFEAGAKIMNCRTRFSAAGEITSEATVRFDQIACWMVRDLPKLRGIALLLHFISASRKLRLQLLAHAAAPDPFLFQGNANDPDVLGRFQYEFEALEALELLSRDLGAPHPEARLDNFSLEEMHGWLEMAVLQRGGRVPLKHTSVQATIELKDGEQSLEPIEGVFRITRSWPLLFQGREVAEIPVDVFFEGYRMAFQPGPSGGAIQMTLTPIDEKSARFAVRAGDLDG